MLENLREVEEGFASNGLSHLVATILARGAKRLVPEEDLVRYDANGLVGSTRRMEGGSDDMTTRAKRANLVEFDRIMAQVPDAEHYDRLPEGYQPAR